MGLALHTRPRAEYQLSTKVGRFLRPVGPEQHEPHGWDNNASLNNVEFSYTHEAIMQQHRESLLRLGCGTIDALVIHDMEQSSEDVPVRPCPPRPYSDPTTTTTTCCFLRGRAAGLAQGANPKGLTVDEHYADLASGGFRALQELRASGAISAFGAGVNADEGELRGSPFGAASMREFNQLYTRKLADLSTEAPIDFFLVK